MSEKKNKSDEPAVAVPIIGEGVAEACEGTEEERSVESFKEAFEKLEGDLKAAEDKYLRAIADLDNMRKRLSREKADWIRYGHEGVVRDLLTIIDNLERGLEAATDLRDGEGEEAGSKGLVEGVELTLKEFLGTLARHGVTPIESVGQAFDPNLHEAVQQIERDDVPPGTVVLQFLSGYRIHDRLLRAAKVGVSSGPVGSEEEGPEEVEGDDR